MGLVFDNAWIFLYITELVIHVTKSFVSIDNPSEMYKLYFNLKLICLLFHMVYIIADVARANLILITFSQDASF